MAILEERSHSLQSGFSVSGDPLPDEMTETTATNIEPGVECEAFVALKELAALVARRRGINTQAFTSKLLELYLSTETLRDIKEGSHSTKEAVHIECQTSEQEKADNGLTLQERRVQRLRSQPQMGDRRHFSFEPGDDQLSELNDRLRSPDYVRPKSPAGSQSTRSSDEDGFHFMLPQDGSVTTPMLTADVAKPSKIPSPVQRPSLSHVRRETSTSSMQTASSRYLNDDRRDSRTSVLTAVRKGSSGSVPRPHFTSRSSSINNLRQTEGQTKLQTGSLRSQASLATIAAIRAVEGNSPGKDGEQTQTVRCARSHTRLRNGPVPENDVPPQRRS